MAQELHLLFLMRNFNMRTYKLYKTMMADKVNAAMYVENGATTSFFFTPDTGEYDVFKEQINADEAQLEDTEGNTMTPEAAKAYIKELP
jgi:hypothetical protein